MNATTRSVAALLLVLAPSTASAQPGRTPPADLPDEKSPAIALGLSLLGTGAGIAALVAASEMEDGAPLGVAGIGALVVGPSLGHFYAGESDRGIRHAAVRLGAVAAMGTGLLLFFSSPCAFGSENECPETREDVGIGIFLAGAAVGVGSTIYSIVDAPFAARRTNRKASSTMLLPSPIVGPDRSTGLGLSLTGSL